MTDIDDTSWPPADIVKITAAPAGWFANYLVEWDEENIDSSTIMTLPVMGWALVEWPDEDEPDVINQAVRAFVVHSNGEAIDFEAVEWPFICITPPGQIPVAKAYSVLKSDSTKVIIEKLGNKEELPS